MLQAIHLRLLLPALFLGTLMLLTGPAKSAQAACGGVTPVVDASEFATAITSFNGESANAGACDFTIQLTANILLPSTWSQQIANNDASDVLTIDGNEFVLDGQGASGVRPIFVGSNSTVALYDITITGGNVTNGGGGIYNAGTLSIVGSTVSNNSTGSPSSPAQGGGIYNAGLQADSLTLHNSTVAGNTASGNVGIGGGIFGRATIINSTISGNTANGTLAIAQGGGIYSVDATITNSTVSDNVVTSIAAAAGGGISNGGTISLIHTTVTNNSVTGLTAAGGGIYMWTTGVVTNLTNSLIVDQTSGSDCAVAGGNISSNGYNLDSDGTCLPVGVATATDFPSGSVFLGPLADNGGPTETHALLESPIVRSTAIPIVNEAIDAIPVSVAAATTESADSPQAVLAICNGVDVTQDQRGFTRPANGACDIGAVESGASDPLAISLSWFLAEENGDTVNIRWQTATESGVAGFHVLADVEGGPVALNDSLIPSPAIDSVSPVAYSFSTATNATHFYLEEVRIDGSTQRHGPFAVGVAFGARADDDAQVAPALYLPFATN